MNGRDDNFARKPIYPSKFSLYLRHYLLLVPVLYPMTPCQHARWTPSFAERMPVTAEKDQFLNKLNHKYN